jgi:FKBP12-rapamycin complex-associated protein
LTLWFKYGDKRKVEDALIDGFNTVSIDTWLQVVPQVLSATAPSPSSTHHFAHDLTTASSPHDTRHTTHTRDTTRRS